MTKTATPEDRLEDWLARIVAADMQAAMTEDDDGVAVADTIAEVVEEAQAAGFDGFIRKAAASLAKDVLTRRYGETTGDLAAVGNRA